MTTPTMAAGPLTPDDRRHGSSAGYVAGCRCTPCRSDHLAYNQRRRRRVGYGIWAPWADAQPVREHIQRLSAYGIGWQRVARRAGVAEQTISGLMYARGGKTRDRCRPHVAAAILAIQPTLDLVADSANVDATGTRRRLQALIAQGHTAKDIAARVGTHPETIRILTRNGGRCTAALARATIRVYDDLWAQRPTGWIADRNRKNAAQYGWATPGAWDDDTIDDPNATAHTGQHNTADVVDEVAIELALAGQRVTLTPTERLAAVKVGRRRGMTLQLIADRLRMSYSKTQHLDKRGPGTPAEHAA